jgi:hypothetical protein
MENENEYKTAKRMSTEKRMNARERKEYRWISRMNARQ